MPVRRFWDETGNATDIPIERQYGTAGKQEEEEK